MQGFREKESEDGVRDGGEVGEVGDVEKGRVNGERNQRRRLHPPRRIEESKQIELELSSGVLSC